MNQNPDVVMQAIRGSNRRRILWGVLIVALVVAGLGLSLRYLTNFFAGPRPITVSELSNIDNADKVERYWVTLTAGKAYNTGWQEVKTSRGGSDTVNASFSVLVVGRSVLLVRQPGDVPASSTTGSKAYTGTLVSVPSDLSTNIVNDIKSQAPEIASQLLPFMLDTSDMRVDGYIGLVIAALATLLALWLLSSGITRTLLPHSHPIWKALNRFGDPQAASDAIRDEMAMPYTQIGKTHVTMHWLVANQAGKFQATRLEDVVWLYHKVTRRRVNGVPAGKTFEGQIWDQYGKLIAFGGTEANVLSALQAIRASAPWAIAGYNAQIETLWKKNRTQFLDSVRQNRLGNSAAH